MGQGRGEEGKGGAVSDVWMDRKETQRDRGVNGNLQLLGIGGWVGESLRSPRDLNRRGSHAGDLSLNA